MKIKILLFISIILLSCQDNPKRISNTEDYSLYLNFSDNSNTIALVKELEFWSNKLTQTPNQFPYLLKIALTESELFKSTGVIDYLISSTEHLKKANEITNYNNAGYLRALARNYISQHQFKEALELLIKAEKNGENLIGTQKMLFDVHLELGNTKEALSYLSSYKNFTDFDYLIRLSKWNDYNGNLESAIHFLEKAKEIAQANKEKDLLQWVYSNLADYYGHNNQIKKSYDCYLKALQINPNDTYSLKGIAWIIYSYEKNPQESLRIINLISKKNQSPDYYLLKAEMADYLNNEAFKNNSIQSYLTVLKNNKYGAMYNKYKVLLFAEELKNVDAAIQIALEEIAHRPTPQSYDLLAWSYHNNGNHLKALQIVEKHVVNKSHEPEILYHLAEIYKANNLLNKTKELKKELEGAAFEMGPVMVQKIQQL